MKIHRLLFLVTAIALAGAMAAAGASAGSARPLDPRRELAEWYANVDRNAPTVLGGLADSPQTMEAIQKRIAAMSDAEVERFRTLMTQAPDWKVAPEAIAAAFPPGVLSQIERAGNDAAARAPEGERTRAQLQTLVAVLEQLPDAKLAELGIERKAVGSLKETLARMSPLEATMLQARAGAATPLDEKSAAAMRSLPPQLQRGAKALAEHGPLTEGDLAELEAFRTELLELFQRIEDLPPESRRMLRAEELQKKVAQLSVAPPDVLFMMRLHLPEAMVETLAGTVALLERVAALDDAGRAELEEFRADFTETFTALDGDAGSAQTTRELMARLGPAELTMLRDAMAPVPGWQVWVPAFYRGIASPQLAERVEAVRGPSADPEAIATAEAFRSQALAYVDAAAAANADAALVARARKAVLDATPERLEILRTVVEGMPAGASTDDMLSVAAMVDFNCWLDLPSPAPDISLDFICNPIESAINAVESAITSTANAVVATAQAAINAAIGAMQTAVNSSIAAVNSVIDTVVSAITDTVDSIWAFLQDIPDLAWEAMQAALDLLLDIEIANGVTVRDLVASGVETALASMRTLVGLSGEWWTAISGFTLPEIPCPPLGFHTPFGNVGESAAANNYGRYRLLIDGIIEMIPDTETSLAIKIPAKVLYMAFDFLGTCLDQAAASADDALAADRHSIVLGNFDALEAWVATEFAGLSSASTDQAGALLAAVGAQSTIIQNLINSRSNSSRSQIAARSDAIQALIASESAGIRSMIGSESDDIQEAVADFRELNLRLVVERVLQSGVGGEVALLELPEPAGHLGLVKEIVSSTLDALAATGQAAGQGPKFYAEGSSLMAAGRYKDAFKQFAMAYREAAK